MPVMTFDTVPPPDVLILGAGAAGLSAAARLHSAGVSVTILEARDQTGGRIRSDHSTGGSPIEDGPEFLHGDSPELEELIRAAGVTVETGPSRHWLSREGQLIEANFEGWEEVLDQLSRIDDDLPFDRFLETRCPGLTPDQRQMAIDYVEGFNAADCRQLSSLWLRKSELELGAAEDEVRRLTSGYDRIIDTLQGRAPDVPLHLATPVHLVQWRRGRVLFETAGPSPQRHSAARAIITLPLGILQAEGRDSARVAFLPDLPDKRAAANRLAMGAVVKVVLRFREPFWQQCGFRDGGFLHLRCGRFMTWWPFGPEPKLTAWSGGPRAEELSQRDDEEITAIAVSELAIALGWSERAVRDQLGETYVFNWPRDPHALGAYSYARVGGAEAMGQLASPVENTLFFAGEATDDQFPATVAGAVRSGYRAADEVLASLK